MTNKETVIRGVVGAVTPVAGAVVSLTQIEAALRIASLCVGIAVGLVTIWKFFKNDK